MDNKVFNVNGKSYEMLVDTLKLKFAQDGPNCRCKGWVISKKGFILYWYSKDSKDVVPLPPPGLTAEEVAPLVFSWLSSLKHDDLEFIEMSDFDKNLNHDGSNSLGWRVYCEDWGRVNGDSSAICAIKPAYMWHGK